MSEPKLGWDTGTVKKMNTVDYLKGFSDGSNKKFEELFEPVEKEIERLHEENKRMREALEEIKDLLHHIWIHDGYFGNGYKQMTTEQKMLYRKYILDKTGFDIFTDESYKKLTNFKTVEKLEKDNG